jgi:hypothetical protein
VQQPSDWDLKGFAAHVVGSRRLDSKMADRDEVERLRLALATAEQRAEATACCQTNNTYRLPQKPPSIDGVSLA